MLRLCLRLLRGREDYRWQGGLNKEVMNDKGVESHRQNGNQ